LKDGKTLFKMEKWKNGKMENVDKSENVETENHIKN